MAAFATATITAAAFALITIFSPSASALRCGKQSVYDNSNFFSCPRPFDSKENVYCCGGGDMGESYCCGKVQSDLNQIGKSVGHIVGIALSAVVLVLLVLMFCCCCCPFCMLAKNKEKSGSYFGRRSASRNAGSIDSAVHQQQPIMFPEHYLQQYAYTPEQIEQIQELQRLQQQGGGQDGQPGQQQAAQQQLLQQRQQQQLLQQQAQQYQVQQYLQQVPEGQQQQYMLVYQQQLQYHQQLQQQQQQQQYQQLYQQQLQQQQQIQRDQERHHQEPR